MPVLVQDEDHRVDVLHDGAETLLALPLRRFGLLARGDIPADADDLLDVAVLIQHRGVHPGQPHPTVPGHGPLLDISRVRRRRKSLHAFRGR